MNIRSNPDTTRAAVTTGAQTLSYAELDALMDRVAATLQAQRAQADVTLSAISDGVPPPKCRCETWIRPGRRRATISISRRSVAR